LELAIDNKYGGVLSYRVYCFVILFVNNLAIALAITIKHFGIPVVKVDN